MRHHTRPAARVPFLCRLEAPMGELLVRKSEAARRLAMSHDSLQRHVLPEISVVRRGGLVLVPVAEMERWVEANAAK
jgi:hypothetical protein